MSFIIDSYRFNSVAIPTGNLIRYIRGHNSVTDETGNSTPVGTGLTYTTGIYSGSANEAIDFNADTDKISIPDAADLSFGDGSSTDSAFSLSLALNWSTDSDNSTATLFMKRGDNGGGTATANAEYQVAIHQTLDEIRVRLFDNGTTRLLGRDGTTALSKSTNYHVVVTYDGSSTESGIKIYIDGTEESSYTSASAGTYLAMHDLSSNLYIGSAGYLFDSEEFLGKMSGIGVWDKELSAAEVAVIYDKQAGGEELL